MRQVNHLYDDLATTYRLPRQEAITWTGDDGQTVEGLLYYPLDEAPGHPYPLVVQTHGGPASSDQFEFGRWNDYVQGLTARGWLVFKPNYRGSAGYGDAYLRDMVGHYFRQAHLDVMTGVEHLIDSGIAEGRRGYRRRSRVRGHHGSPAAAPGTPPMGAERRGGRSSTSCAPALDWDILDAGEDGA